MGDDGHPREFPTGRQTVLDPRSISMASFSPSPAAVADIGVTGMAVMGSNLARNLARNGFKVAIHNRSVAKTEKVFADYGSEGEFYPSESVDEFVASLQKPRVAIIMVKAGGPTDAVIDELAARMEEGDIIVDCGNALFTDTRRREAALKEKGLHFVGAGVSGGEEGALNGPSIMPGGTTWSYDRLRRPVLHPRGGRWSGSLRQDGPQRHRVRGHAGHLRGVRAHEQVAGPARLPDR
jgi:6-phosphogluconate dehydrogenase (decarboxylating)